jgi:hypothetical protein
MKHCKVTAACIAATCLIVSTQSALAIDVKTAIARQTVSDEGADGKTRVEVEFVTIVKHPELLALRSVVVPSGVRWVGERSKTDNADCRADAAVGSNCRQSHYLTFEGNKRCAPTSGYTLQWDVSCATGKSCPPGSAKHETPLRLQAATGC